LESDIIFIINFCTLTFAFREGFDGGKVQQQARIFSDVKAQGDALTGACAVVANCSAFAAIMRERNKVNHVKTFKTL
jgi:hypothetical protein